MAQRTCACGADLSGLNHSAKRCGECCADMMRAAGVEPLEPYPGNNQRKWKCRCLRCGEIVEPRFAGIQQGGGGCDPCGRRVQAKGRRLSESEAAEVMRAGGLEPLEPYVASSEPWECRCMKCGEVVSPRYNDVQQGQGGCWPCGRAASAEAQRIPQGEAIALAEAAGLRALEPYRSNSKRWPCMCLACGRKVAPMLTSLQRGSAGCGYCSRYLLDPDEAIAAMRAAGEEPLEPYPGADVPWLCRCLDCERVRRRVYWVVVAGHRCRWCSMTTSGFRPAEPAVVYLITHTEYDAVKIGIMNEGNSRLALHQRHGWRIVTTVRAPGEVAEAIECEILTWWRVGLCLPRWLGREEMPQGGWTETVAACDVDLGATMRRIRRLVSVG